MMPIEEAVIEKICHISSLIKWKSKDPVIRKPEIELTPADWARKVTFHLMTDQITSICVIKGFKGTAGMVTEYHVFSDTLKERNPINKQKHSYFEQDQEYLVDFKDINQLSGRVASHGFYDRLQMLRMAEREYWKRWERINQMEGILSLDPDKSRMSGTPEEILKNLNETIDRLKNHALAITPPDAVLGNAIFRPGTIDMEKLLETVVRQYCYLFELPTSLMNLDLPTHSEVSFSAAYGGFLRQKLIPMWSPVFQILESISGYPIEVDYGQVEKASESEMAEIAVRLGQSGTLTIDEIREKLGYPKLPGGKGEDFPTTAGAGKKEDKEEGNNGTQAG